MTEQYPPHADEGPAARLADEIKVRRKTAGLSQPQLAHRVGYTRQYVSFAERPGRNLPSHDLVHALDSALGADGALIQLWVQAKEAQRAKRMRVRVDSDPLHSTHYSNIAQLVTQVTASATSSEVIEQYSRATESLAHLHTQVTASEIIREVMGLHGRIQNLLESKIRLSHQRELYRLESDLLAHACLLFGDLGRNEIAEMLGLAALAYSREAGSCQAYARSALAKTYRWQERYVESADIARQGFEQCPDIPVKVQLASQEANALALLGDSPRAGRALARARSAADTVRDGDSDTSAWSFSMARQAVFAQSVATHSGDPRAALRAATAADEYRDAGGPCIPATWAQVRVGAGTAHLAKGEIDAAVAEVAPALTLAPGLRVSTVTAYISNFIKELSRHPLADTRTAIEFRERCEEFNFEALPDLRDHLTAN